MEPEEGEEDLHPLERIQLQIKRLQAAQEHLAQHSRAAIIRGIYPPARKLLERAERELSGEL
jgi:hypothetical protein